MIAEKKEKENLEKTEEQWNHNVCRYLHGSIIFIVFCYIQG